MIFQQSQDGNNLQNKSIMSLKQLGNYKMESKSYGANREVRARKKLKKFRKKMASQAALLYGEIF